VYFCWRCGSRYPTHQAWCTVCQDSGTVVIEPIRPSAQMRTQMQAASARDLVGRKWTLVESAAYPELCLSRGALVALWGQPGSGKSTFATRFANGLVGAVTYYSAEEKLGPTFAGRLERCGVTRADFFAVGQASIDDLCEFCSSVRAVALVVDSVQMTTIRPEDLRRLLEAASVDVLVYILHATKENAAAGSNAYLHEADVVVQAADLQWTLTKSRYQQCESVAHPIG